MIRGELIIQENTLYYASIQAEFGRPSRFLLVPQRRHGIRA